MSLIVTVTKPPNTLILSKVYRTPFLRRMDLVIQLYLYHWQAEQDPYRRQVKYERQMEIDECFQRNLHHPAIRVVYLLCESREVADYYLDIAKSYNKVMKCVFVNFGKQPTYADFLRYVAHQIPDNHIVCIQNSDIFIDHSVSKEFLDRTVGPYTLVALTRHEYTDEEHSECSEKTCPLIWDYQGSHDTFLFRMPLPPTLPLERVNHHQNVYGGETLFMKAFQDAGKVLVNPCFDMRIFHRHRNRAVLANYPTLADGYLCHVNPVAPQGRDDIRSKLKTLFKD